MKKKGDFLGPGPSFGPLGMRREATGAPNSETAAPKPRDIVLGLLIHANVGLNVVTANNLIDNLIQEDSEEKRKAIFIAATCPGKTPGVDLEDILKKIETNRDAIKANKAGSYERKGPR